MSTFKVTNEVGAEEEISSANFLDFRPLPDGSTIISMSGADGDVKFKESAEIIRAKAITARIPIVQVTLDHQEPATVFLNYDHVSLVIPAPSGTGAVIKTTHGENYLVKERPETLPKNAAEARQALFGVITEAPETYGATVEGPPSFSL